MTVVNILIYVALIGYILFRRVQGQPVKAGRKLFVLPVLLVVIGYGDLVNGSGSKPTEITLTVIGGALSLGLGALRGRADKLSDRDGSPFVQWGAASLILFGSNIVAKLVLDLIGIAAGGSGSAVGKSLLLTFGLTLLGEAIVIWVRTQGATGLVNPPRVRSDQGRDGFAHGTPPPAPSTRYQTDDRANATVPSREAVAAGSTTAARTVADALIEHHQNHHDKHDHGRRHDHGRS